MLKLFLLKKVVRDGQGTVRLIHFRFRISSGFHICFWGIMYVLCIIFCKGGVFRLRGTCFGYSGMLRQIFIIKSRFLFQRNSIWF